MPLRHALFCYGTLGIPQMMRAVSGNRTSGDGATLAGYQCLSLFGAPYPAIIPRADQYTDGILYRSLTQSQLARVDHYEGRQYLRIRVSVSTQNIGTVQAWTYVLHPRYYHQIKRRPWSMNEFRSRYQDSYLYRHGR